MKVIVLGSFFKQKHVQQIQNVATEVGAEVCFVATEREIPEDFHDAEILYGFGTETAKTSPALKWLAVPSAGVNYLMGEDAFANKNCMLTNSTGAFGVTIAEHIIGVTLMLMRQFFDVCTESRNGVWSSPRPQKSLKDSRITVLGTGNIGQCFAERVRAFEPKEVVGISRSGKGSDQLFDRMAKVEDLEQWLPLTDLLVMSLPETPETINILSHERINMMPHGALIVNVGRGTAIDEDALADALESGQIGGAALDVFRVEPLPSDSRLWHAKNLLITPHVAGGFTVDYTVDRNVEMFCENLRNYASGKPLERLIDWDKGY